MLDINKMKKKSIIIDFHISKRVKSLQCSKNNTKNCDGVSYKFSIIIHHYNSVIMVFFYGISYDLGVYHGETYTFSTS